MSYIFYLIYFFIYLISLHFILKNNSVKFLSFFFILISISPLLQYFHFEEYKTIEGYRDLSFQRVFLEYFNFFLLFSASIRFKYNIGYFSIFLFFFVLLSFSSIFNAIDPERAINGILMSVINPILFVITVSENKSLINYKKVFIKFMIISCAIGVFIKFGSNIFNQIRGASSSLLIGYGANELGIFRSNSATNFLSIFLPIFLFYDHGYIENSQKQIFKVLKYFVIFIFIITGSRTGYLIIVLLIIYALFAKKISFRNSLLYFGFIFLVFSFYEFYNKIALDAFVIDRFVGEVNISNSANYDGRFYLWSSVLEFKENFYSGNGISNYFLYFNKYSNAHNLFLNYFFERGFINLLLLIFLILFSLNSTSKILRLTKNQSTLEFFRYLRLGLICFLIASVTGESFVSISQTAHSFGAYIFFMSTLLPIIMVNKRNVIN